MVRYDRQRVESSTPGSTSAPVGQASRHRVQRAALLEPLRVGLERSVHDDLAEEQPRAELGVDQAGVLADPAEPGVLRVDALLHRAGVDVARGLERLGRHRRASRPAARRGAPRARRDSRRPRRSATCAPAPAGSSSRVRAIGVVERAGHDDAARAGHDVPHVAAQLGRLRQPAHLAGVAAVEPFAEERQLGKAVGGGDAAQVEPERARPGP